MSTTCDHVEEPDAGAFETHLEQRLLALAPELRSGPILVAWSSGLDSTALFEAMHRVGRRTGSELAAVFFHHGLRQQADDEARHCLARGRAMGVHVMVRHLELDQGRSPQTEARARRYAILAEAAHALGCRMVATAHHAEDVLETAVLRWQRGAGAAGLSSLRLAELSVLPGDRSLRLWRPMLHWKKSAILQYALARGLRWFEDASNTRTDYQRNRTRHDLMPHLVGAVAQWRPGLETSLDNLADEAKALAQWASAVDAQARVNEPHCHALAWQTPFLRDLPRAIVATVLRSAANDLGVEGAWSRELLLEANDRLQASLYRADSTWLDARGSVLRIGPRTTTMTRTLGRGTRQIEPRVAWPVWVDLHASPEGELGWFGWVLRWGPSRRLPADAAPSSIIANSNPSGLIGRLDVPRGVRHAVVAGGNMDATTRRFGVPHGKIRDALRALGIEDSARWRYPVVGLVSGEEEQAVCEALWIPGSRRFVQSVHRKVAPLPEASGLTLSVWAGTGSTRYV